VDKVIEALRNWWTEFVLATFKELQLVTLNVFLPFVYPLQCSCRCISHCVEWQSVWKKSENGGLIRFWKRTDRWYAFSWSICHKICHIIRCIESDSFYGYVGMYESWEDNISQEEQWAKHNINRNRSSYYIEKDCFEKWQNYCSTLNSRTKYVFISKTLFPQKLYDVSFTNPTFTAGLQLLNVWLLKVMFRCVNDGVPTVKPGHKTTGNARDMVRWVVLHAVPYFRNSLRLENAKEAYIA
jgi:hypothetical protein